MKQKQLWISFVAFIVLCFLVEIVGSFWTRNRFNIVSHISQTFLDTTRLDFRTCLDLFICYDRCFRLVNLPSWTFSWAHRCFDPLRYSARSEFYLVISLFLLTQSYFRIDWYCFAMLIHQLNDHQGLGRASFGKSSADSLFGVGLLCNIT